MEFRLQLSTAAITYAQLQVLALEPRDKTEMFFSRYISCELQPYARDCEKHNEDIGQYLWRNPNATDEELVGYLNLQSALYLYHLNGLQIMRGDFERFDFKDNKDWFRPFVRSMLIWHEHLIRQKIGLPNLMPDPILPIQHSTFFNIVRDGHEHPLYEFERHYGVRHDAIC